MATGDSLLFDGVDDTITFAVGGLGAFGPATFGAIIKINALVPVGQTWSVFTAGTGGDWIVQLGDDESPGAALSSGFSFVADGLASGGWEFVGLTKATGTANTFFHRYDGTTWTHVDSGTALANSSAPATSFKMGTGFDTPFNGNILIAGFWNTVLTNIQIEALTNYAAWVAAAPREGWKCDTMSAIQSFGTVGTADESSRTGTTLDTGDVPSWWSEGAAAIAVPAPARPLLPRLQRYTQIKAPLFLGFPQPNLETPAAGVVYQPTGSLTAGTVASGDGIHEYIETGSLTAGTVASGTDAEERQETGSLTTRALASGADVFEASETGSLTTRALTSGADVFEHNETGSLTSQVLPSGADVFTAAETGTAPVGTLLSGTSQYIPAGPVTYAKAGALTAGTVVSGTDSEERVETGSVTAGTSLSGVDSEERQETGTAPVGTVLSGVSVKVTSGVYAKTGSLTAGTQPRGADAYTAAETGSLTAGALESGADASTFVETGALLVDTLLSGVQQYVPPAPPVTAGQAAVTAATGNDVTVTSPVGAAVSAADASTSPIAVGDASGSSAAVGDGSGADVVVVDVPA